MTRWYGPERYSNRTWTVLGNPQATVRLLSSRSRRIGRAVPAGHPARNRPRLLDAQDRLRFRPVLFELVEVALRGREAMDDDRAEVDQDPVRGGFPFASDRPETLCPQALEHAVGDRVELPLRAARADEEVVGEGGQPGEVQEDDVR